MAKDFVKLSEVTMLEEVTDNASVLVEQNGEIYRAPKTQVGGAGSVKTAIIRDSGYLNAIAGLSTMATAAPEYTYECINMTFEEAYETMLNGEPLDVFGMITSQNHIPLNIRGMAVFGGTAKIVAPCIVVQLELIMSPSDISIFPLYWTSDGLSTARPGDDK